MTGLFGSLNTATKGLHAQQTALETVGHNVSNSNTIGYTRQRVNMQADIATRIAGIGQIGTGVRVSGIERVHDSYITTQLRDANSTLNSHKALSNIIGELEAVFNEPSDTGLSNKISDVFNAWSYLASNPEQASARTSLVQTTETFTDTIHHMANAMENLHNNTVNELNKSALDANSDLKQLEKLNEQIFQASVRGFTPNDLLDKQDQILSNLAGKLDISTEKDKFNRVTVKVGEETVLDSDTRKELAVVTGKNDEGNYDLAGGGEVVAEEGSDFKLGSIVITSKDDNTATLVKPETGTMKGTQDALKVISKGQDDLNKFASDFGKAVNKIHSNDGKGLPFFENIDAENAAASIKISSAIQEDSNLIVAGKETSSEENNVTGDGSRAQAISNLKNTILSSDSKDWVYDEKSMSITGSKNGDTLFGKYNSMVTEVGIVKQQEDSMLETQNGLTALLTQRRESVSGVDINEEVVDMIKYQSAFQANSRVLQTISEMLDTLINRTGV